MTDRKYSDPTIWGISIDWDDSPDGSDGGYDSYGNYINPEAMMELVSLRKEVERLKGEIAAHCTAYLEDWRTDRDQLRQAVEERNQTIRLNEKKIERLERENFALAAGACVKDGPIAGPRGHALCPMDAALNAAKAVIADQQREIKRLENLLMVFADPTEMTDDDAELMSKIYQRFEKRQRVPK